MRYLISNKDNIPGDMFHTLMNSREYTVIRCKDFAIGTRQTILKQLRVKQEHPSVFIQEQFRVLKRRYEQSFPEDPIDIIVPYAKRMRRDDV